MTAAVSTTARAVVIGGGIVGCSVAYHLTKLGWSDVVLLERRELSSGTTWHAAGLVGPLRSTRTLTTLSSYGGLLYGQLEAETGQATGYRECGRVSVARTAERMVELRREASRARSFGIDVEVIAPREVGRLWPLLRTDDLLGALWMPKDGRTDPVDTTRALARGAQLRGARIVENVTVTGVRRRNAAVTGVATTHGDIACEVVVNCAGMWARHVGALAGVAVPLHAVEHFYFVTEPLAGVMAALPILRDSDGGIYVREEVGGLLVGGFEPAAKPWGMTGIPDDFSFSLLPDDWDHIQVFVKPAIERIPALESARIRRQVNGPESFTPDTRYILGEAPELRGFFVAAGFSSLGIASAAGAGKALAEWILAGEPSLDLWGVDIRRFGSFQCNPRYLHDRSVEAVGLLYAMHWPFRQFETARSMRRSVLHDRLAARGACFGTVAGWERPDWYACDGLEPKYVYTYGRPNWLRCSAAEHHAARTAAGVVDQSCLGKFQLEGPEAEALLGRLCASDVAIPVGKVIHTIMLNDRGGVECKVMVARLSEVRYLIVTAAAVAVHDFDWIRRHLDDKRGAVLTDITSAYGAVSVVGPRSRELLCRLTPANLTNSAFPFGTAQETFVHYAPVIALRTTYVGELGWELFCHTEYAAGMYDAILEEGKAMELRHVGNHAVESLRIEKGYPAWGHELNAEQTPLEAGLSSWVAFDKGIGFVGLEALLNRRRQGVRSRLLLFILDDPAPMLLGGEPVYRDGILKGRITSGAYGHTVGRSVGMGYVGCENAMDTTGLVSGTYEIDIAGDRFLATAHIEPVYDPRNARLDM